MSETIPPQLGCTAVVMPAYVVCRKDFEFLENIVPLDDWAELQGELHLLMQTPTKKQAASFYARAIALWFFEQRSLELTTGLRRIRDRHIAFRA